MSRGKFVTYAAVFLDFGGLEASVGLELLLSMLEPLPRLGETVAGGGSCFSSLVRQGPTNVNIHTGFREG